MESDPLLTAYIQNKGTEKSCLITIFITIKLCCICVSFCLYGKDGLKSNNLHYNTLGRWVDHLIDQETDGLSIILID